MDVDTQPPIPEGFSGRARRTPILGLSVAALSGAVGVVIAFTSCLGTGFVWTPPTPTPPAAAPPAHTHPHPPPHSNAYYHADARLDQAAAGRAGGALGARRPERSDGAGD